MRAVLTCMLLCVAAFSGFSQVTTTAQLDGTVLDPQAAAVPGAQVTVVQTATGQSLRATTDEKGYWALPSLPTGFYKVTVTHEGFKATTSDNVKLDAGVPATVNITLTVGAATETVEVTAGAEIVQTNSATVSSTLQGRQINDLPFTSHNVTELIAGPARHAERRWSPLLHHQRLAADHDQHHHRWHQRAGQCDQEQSGRDFQRRSAAHAGD